MEGNFKAPPSSLSRTILPIAGILCTVFGLEELPKDTSDVACLWLLHPRLETQACMAGVATAVIDDWNQRLRSRAFPPAAKIRGLIAVSFDQRNHGTRKVDALANEAWRQGNDRHAQDMFSCFQGTARDVSLLIDYLPSYIFPRSEYRISEHLALGVSLGGHATWSCLFHEPRISTGVVIIGCPDYVNLLADRARLSKRDSWKKTEPPGSQFLGSADFPTSLLETVRRYDPAGLVLNHTNFGAKDAPLRQGPLPDPSDQEVPGLRTVLSQTIGGKRILNISGGIDKLVPYARGESFLTWLKKAIAPGGWFSDGGVYFEDLIFKDAAHELNAAMVDEVIRFVAESLTVPRGSKTGVVREAKI